MNEAPRTEAEALHLSSSERSPASTDGLAGLAAWEAGQTPVLMPDPPILPAVIVPH